MPGPSDRLSQHGTMRKVAVFSSFGAHNRSPGKRCKKRTSPTRTTSGGGGPRRSSVHLPNTLHHAPATSAESRTARPSESPAHRADRADRRANNTGGPHARGQRRRRPRALAAASPGSRMIERRLAVGEKLAEDRQQAGGPFHSSGRTSRPVLGVDQPLDLWTSGPLDLWSSGAMEQAPAVSFVSTRSLSLWLDPAGVSGQLKSASAPFDFPTRFLLHRKEAKGRRGKNV